MFTPESQLMNDLQDYLHGEEFRRHYRKIPDKIFNKVLRFGAPLGSLIEVHGLLPRCMGRLKEMAAYASDKKSVLPSGTVVIAKQMVEGCGRFDREWFAPAGGFWMAVAWADTLLPEFAGLLPLAAGTASCESIRNLGVNASVKWVNDVLVGGRKIGGILCETITGSSPEDRYHLIGIGINCNNNTFPEELRSNATSLCNEKHEEIDLEKFTLELLAHLAWNFGLVHLFEEQALAAQGDGKKEVLQNPVVEAWKRLSDSIGRKVVYGFDVLQKPLYKATVLDIDHLGGLVMRLENGSIVTENSGEILYLDD